MHGTPSLVLLARIVKLVTTVAVVAVLIGFVALQSFSQQYGSLRPTDVVDEPDEALLMVVAEQESSGLTCRAKPAVTDVVLFQQPGSSAVRVLTFEQAIAALSAREGSIRRYCVPARGSTPQ